MPKGFIKTTDDRTPTPVETRQLFAADDRLNRELDALRQQRYRDCESELEYVHAEFEQVCLAEIQAAVAGVIPFARTKSRTQAAITTDG
jgi:hypothetical protein